MTTTLLTLPRTDPDSSYCSRGFIGRREPRKGPSTIKVHWSLGVRLGYFEVPTSQSSSLEREPKVSKAETGRATRSVVPRPGETGPGPRSPSADSGVRTLGGPSDRRGRRRPATLRRVRPRRVGPTLDARRWVSLHEINF